LGISTLGALPNAFKIPVNGYKKLKEYFLCELRELGGKIKQPAALGSHWKLIKKLSNWKGKLIYRHTITQDAILSKPLDSEPP